MLSYFSCYEDTDNGTASTVSSVASYQLWPAKDVANLRDEGFFFFLIAMSINLSSCIFKSSLELVVAQETPLGKGNHLWFYLFTERQSCDHTAKLRIKGTGPNCSNLHTPQLRPWHWTDHNMSPTGGTYKTSPGPGSEFEGHFPVSEKPPMWILDVWDYNSFSNFLFFSLTCKIPSLGCADVQAWVDWLPCGIGSWGDRMGGSRVFFLFPSPLHASYLLPKILSVGSLHLSLGGMWVPMCCGAFLPQHKPWGDCRVARGNRGCCHWGWCPWGRQFNELEALSKLLGLELLCFGQQALVRWWFLKSRSAQGCLPQAWFPWRDRNNTAGNADVGSLLPISNENKLG